jgi:hypothetical protein
LQASNVHGHAKKGVDDQFFIKKFIYFFERFVPSGISQSNQHHLIFHGHGSHVILKAIEYIQ